MTLARRLKTKTATLTTLAMVLLATTAGTVVAHTDGTIGGTHSWGGRMWGDGWMTGPDWMGLWGLLWIGLLIAVPPCARVHLRRAPRYRARNWLRDGGASTAIRSR